MIQVRANGVFRDDDGLVACCHARMYAGQVFPVHSHKENEIFIIYSGCLDVFTETEPGKFQRNRLQPPHGLLFVNAGTNHYGECIHDMAGLFVTMPAAIEFP
jgi:quercetin dioxygenase-like cupin family protein